MPNSKTIGVAYSDPALSGGTLDDTAIGDTTKSTGKFTTLNVTGATTLDGSVAIGNAAADAVGFYGVTATAQLVGASQTAITMSATSTTTQLRTDLNKVHVLLSKIRNNLKTLGLIKGLA